MTEEILAPLSGTLCKSLVNVGDEVEEEEETFIIEAMKMETPIYAPCDGIIREIRAKEGEVINVDDVIAIIQK